MNKKRPTAGLFDHQDRQAKLAKLNDVLVRLKAQVDWGGFRPVVEEAFPSTRASVHARAYCINTKLIRRSLYVNARIREGEDLRQLMNHGSNYTFTTPTTPYPHPCVPICSSVYCSSVLQHRRK